MYKDQDVSRLPLVKVVGVSAAGKSTLVHGLRQAGYNARAASQEHSQVPDMWQRIHPPAVLIYVHADLACQRCRRPDVTWDRAWLAVEMERLVHARQHADLAIDTGRLTREAVLARAIAFLEQAGVAHADRALPSALSTGAPAQKGP